MAAFVPAAGAWRRVDAVPRVVRAPVAVGSSSFAGAPVVGRSSFTAPSVAPSAPAARQRSVRMQQAGLFTGSKPADRRITAPPATSKKVMKVVYVVLESQYQSSMSAAARTINAKEDANLSLDVAGYLLEELRDEENYAQFKKDVADANVFIGSLIFVQELAERVTAAVEPHRERLDACIIFPSMPEVMRLNKLGTFNMSQLGQSKSAIASFMKKRREESGASFEDGMLKLLRTLPKVLKYLPTDKAQDARSFMLSFQYWLGGSPTNLENFLLMVAEKYVDVDTGAKSNQAVAAPEVFPDTGIWHPVAPRMFEDLGEYLEWYDKEHCPLANLTAASPTVGLVMQRTHMITGDDCHYISLVSELEAGGARVIPVFAGGLDFSVPVNAFFFHPGTDDANVDVVVSLTGFALVGGPARQDHPKAIEALSRLDRPYLCALPLVFQTTEEWKESELGLHPVQVALQVSLPELDGALEPVIFAGRDGKTGRSIPLQDRISALAQRSLKWANLRRKQVAEKKVAITVFSFPPDKGNVGTAAYLDVFGSVHKVLQGLAKEGYCVGDIPETSEELLEAVVHDKEARINSPELNVAYKMPISEYEEVCTFSEKLHENWGPPPGHLNTDGTNLLVYGKHFGNVFVGVQPSFGYEGDPMRLLFSKSASPHHGFAAYYAYLEKVWKADAVLHFGTHGSLEFMPGKQVGMSGDCFPDKLIHTIPNIYYYAANNPSEATIAKRRSYAATISYLTPPAENAGLYKGLKELSELVASYQTLKDTGRGPAIVNSIADKARICNMDRDVALPEGDAKELSAEERDDVVGKVYVKLIEIESRLLPCGLHTVGRPPTAAEAVATLVNIAALDRPEESIVGMPRLLAASVGRDIDEVYASSDAGKLADVELLFQITTACREAVTALVKASTNEEGRVEKVQKFDLGAILAAQMGRRTPWSTALAENGFPSVEESELKPLVAYLEFCLEQVVADNELGALVAALEGKYVIPGPGGDPIRNPDVLPTGKNIHALDPQSIPTSAAVDSAKVVVDRLLERQRLDNGGVYPESIALVLWGTDNIKTYGESLAQVLWMVGVRPLADALGRVSKLQLIPIEELGRPRVDVVVNCSGVFRDLFINQMALLDRAVKMAAEADESPEVNFVRKHALEQAEELGVTVREAATRVFSNSSGSYSSNVSLAVENGGWEDEQQLRDMYMSRKGFAFNSDKPGVMEVKPELFRSSLAKVEVTFQNLDSSEISLTDVSHYFDSDPTKIVAQCRADGKKPVAFIADTTTANAQVRTLSETVRLDARTKLLNPKWYEGMMASGYEGARELSKRLRNTMGWSATSGDVDNWVYEDANETFMADEEMQKRLLDLNPNSFRSMVTTLLEANGRGYWETSEENLDRLRELYQEVEDRIEGVE
ncbi:hypothetical protein BU14_0809s0010 [Porphyra umbilicalis]|uniref:magnesium chelatase n=1 Tax=Porphyra umbilicalis TaxID=2786 RepID=A0A1X6NP82_PORUM|nr:hypothetical protein BU14_0809s0010 [Porphyra umbilicalis]|eukprot:OSX70306.1 hypothetical protein BU14_0809s0010 [Porphyra umbilicalis]